MQPRLPKTEFYPSGEVSFTTIGSELVQFKPFRADLKNGNDFLNLCFAISTVEPAEVFLPFLPYARQDRICWQGEAFSLKVALVLLKASGLSALKTFDVHAPYVTAALWGPGFTNLSPEPFWEQILHLRGQKHADVLFVAPDAGSAKKVENFAGRNYVQALKKRTGKDSIRISIFSDVDLKGRDCLILDDICDGGGTFIPLAAQLKEQGAREVSLVVSHGLFTKGIYPLLKGGVDRIYTTDSCRNGFTEGVIPEGVIIPLESLNERCAR